MLFYPVVVLLLILLVLMLFYPVVLLLLTLLVLMVLFLLIFRLLCLLVVLFIFLFYPYIFTWIHFGCKIILFLREKTS
jgi:hypothetical protein